MITVFSNVVQQDTLKGLWKGLVPVSISALIFNDKITAYILDSSQLEYNSDDAKMHLLNSFLKKSKSKNKCFSVAWWKRPVY